MPSHQEVLEAYSAAWDETDSYARLELMNTAWTDNAPTRTQPPTSKVERPWARVFAEDGRLESITGFFRPTPPAPS